MKKAYVLNALVLLLTCFSALFAQQTELVLTEKSLDLLPHPIYDPAPEGAEKMEIQWQKSENAFHTEVTIEQNSFFYITEAEGQTVYLKSGDFFEEVTLQKNAFGDFYAWDLRPFAGQTINLSVETKNEETQPSAVLYTFSKLNFNVLESKPGTLVSINAPNTVKLVAVNTGLPAKDFQFQYAEAGKSAVQQTFSAAEVLPFSVFSIEFEEKWLPKDKGAVQLSLQLKAANGAEVEDDVLLLNHTATAANSTNRTIMSEMFSSSTCGPCGQWNQGVYTPVMKADGWNWPGTRKVVSKIQIPIPIPGDPSNNAHANARRSAMNVNSTPRTFIDGNLLSFVGGQTSTTYQSVFRNYANEALQEPAFIEISVDQMEVTDLGNNELRVRVTGQATALTDIHVPIRLRIHVLNRDYVFQASQNGDRNYSHVMRRIMPSALGTFINDFTEGTTISFDESFDFTVGGVIAGEFNLWNDRVEAIVVMQNASSNEVLQAAITNPGLSNNLHTNEASELKLYPNPTADFFTLEYKAKESGDFRFEVLNTQGQLINQQNQRLQTGDVFQDTYNTANWPSGVYLLRIQTEKGAETKRIVVSH